MQLFVFFGCGILMYIILHIILAEKFMDEKEFYLEKLDFWEKLSEKEKDTVRNNCVMREYKKGQIIHGGERECLGMITVISGETRTCIISEEGREVTLFRLYEGDSCVLSASCVIDEITFETLVIAQQDTKLLIITAGAFASVTQSNIYARCYMYELITQRFSAVMWTMQMILFKGYDRRLASFLISEYEKSGSRTISMTHEEIAQHTNSAREVVARMLKRFVTEGLVEIKRGSVTLVDINALYKLAE